MLLYDIIDERIDDNLKRESKEISTERGRMKRIYTGRIRILRNKITKKEIEEEEYYLLVERLSEIDYKFYWHKELKSSWERRKQKMKKSISSPVLRNTGEKLLICIKRNLKKYFKESIEIFELEDVLDIREVNDVYGKEICAVVITDISREEDIESDKLLKVANALQREDLKEDMDNSIREMTRAMLSRYMERRDRIRVRF